MGFEERLESGREVESLVEDYMRSYGFTVENNTVDPNVEQSIWDNLKWGDTFIKFGEGAYERLSFDEKRGTFISKRSLECFKGSYFILTPRKECMDENYQIILEKIGNARVYKRSTLSSYAKPISADRYKIAKSGSPGLYFDAVENYMRLEDFMIELVKIHLHPRYGGEFHQIISGICEVIDKKMNKRLPKGVEQTLKNTYLGEQ